jgi:DNA polymerase (family 10)
VPRGDHVRDALSPTLVPTLAIDRLAVAAALREIGLFLEIEPGSGYRARAFIRGGEALERLDGDFDALVRARRLTTIAGIGDSLAATITELATTGRSGLLERLRDQFPPGALELHPVLSLRRIRAVHDALGITTLQELREACEAGRLRGVPGFGVRTEEQIRKRIAAFAARSGDALLPEADAEAELVVAHLRRHPAVVRVEVAGNLRRRTELIPRLDVAIAATDAVAALAHASTLPAAQGGDDGLVRRIGALDVQVHVAAPERFAATWVRATGSVAHVAKLAARAAARRLDLGMLDAASEGDVYAALGLPWIAPELREDAGEIEAAEAGTLPDELVRVDDVQGAVHCHTVWSDGRHTIEEMARAADALGLRYLTLTDHSQTAGYAGGLDVERLRRQWDEIAAVQESVSVRLLRGTESDILGDGALDFPDAVLAQLDVVIASIHNRHGLDAPEMTERLCRALRHPVFKIWGHALGRYVRTRPPFACDVLRVLDVAAESRVAIEVNGDPHRLALEPRWIREARARGIRFVVSSDAHSTRAIANARFGVDMARRGWLGPDDVLNTRDPEALAEAVRP